MSELSYQQKFKIRALVRATYLGTGRASLDAYRDLCNGDSRSYDYALRVQANIIRRHTRVEVVDGLLRIGGRTIADLNEQT